MIRSFANKDTEALFNGQRVRRLPPDILIRALAMLRRIDAASLLSDLAIPPGNQLEALKRDRQGQHSVRINQQWRVCFMWRDGDAFDVEIVDYH
ncbi:MAG: plasmid maintenance system killer [Sphingomonadales bacterium 32-65-25]|nr:MAG: plasmid maintenance system killer [Sphingomonadales bacterium 12-62-5]OYX77369.1 MAG: plasmid maintenance system killer [Sphingomonadales bacterium 32-65-25]